MILACCDIVLIVVGIGGAVIGLWFALDFWYLVVAFWDVGTQPNLDIQKLRFSNI